MGYSIYLINTRNGNKTLVRVISEEVVDIWGVEFSPKETKFAIKMRCSSSDAKFEIYKILGERILLDGRSNDFNPVLRYGLAYKLMGIPETANYDHDYRYFIKWNDESSYDMTIRLWYDPKLESKGMADIEKGFIIKNNKIEKVFRYQIKDE